MADSDHIVDKDYTLETMQHRNQQMLSPFQCTLIPVTFIFSTLVQINLAICGTGVSKSRENSNLYKTKYAVKNINSCNQIENKPEEKHLESLLLGATLFKLFNFFTLLSFSLQTFSFSIFLFLNLIKSIKFLGCRHCLHYRVSKLGY